MKKIILLSIFLFFPFLVSAQMVDGRPDAAFRAKVLEIVEQRENLLPDNTKVFQQNVKLEGLSGQFSGQEIFFNGIADFDVLNKNIYKPGDRVMVLASADDQGNVSFYIVDFIRTSPILWLFLIFVATLLFVGRGKGLRSLLSLALTFFIIIEFIVPRALSGGSIILPTILGGVFIIGVVVYLTEGIKTRSHIAVFSTIISLSIIVFISWLFVELSKLAGLGSEEISSLINIGEGVINFKGLLLSGIIIGALGVMDDVIISQVVSVEQLHEANKEQDEVTLYKKAMEIGVSHIGSMTNTLFLAYAGVSLPLLVLFVSGESAFSNWTEVVNNEMIATEIVRTLSGSIGLILAVPISTYFSVWWIKRRGV